MPTLSGLLRCPTGCRESLRDQCIGNLFEKDPYGGISRLCHLRSPPLSQMPVLIGSGGIVPLRTAYVSNQAESPLRQLTVHVVSGSTTVASLPCTGGRSRGPLAPASALIAFAP